MSVKGDNAVMASSFTRTVRLKVRGESYAWLNAVAIEVNQVFNYCNETSLAAATRTEVGGMSSGYNESPSFFGTPRESRKRWLRC